MSGSLGRAAAALLRWGRGAGGGLRGPGVRAAGSGGGGGSAEQLDALVKKDKVVVFLKGTPEQPQCGFSNAVVQILRLHGVSDYAAYNVLDDPQLRQGQARRVRGRGGGPGRSAGPGLCLGFEPGQGTGFCRVRGPGTGDVGDLSRVWALAPLSARAVGEPQRLADPRAEPTRASRGERARAASGVSGQQPGSPRSGTGEVGRGIVRT